MSGTKAIWIVALLLLGAAVTLMVLPDRAGTPDLRAHLAQAEDVVRPGDTSPAPRAAPVAAATPAAPATPAASPKPAKQPVVRAADAVVLGMDQKIKQATVAEGNIVPRQDAKTGEAFLLADERYEIRGKGTFEEPYRVSWECLASASKTYLPRLHEYDIPQRVALLNGKWLRMDGFLAFPLMVSETRELMIMLNQWDGCCIGVPPTPYDAIEVKLLEPAKRSGAHALFNYGAVQGKMRVDPYIVDNFLGGLYVLDDAFLLKDVKPEL